MDLRDGTCIDRSLGRAKGAVSLFLIMSIALPSSQLTSFLPSSLSLLPFFFLTFSFSSLYSIKHDPLCLPVFSSNLAPQGDIQCRLKELTENVKLTHQ